MKLLASRRRPLDMDLWVSRDGWVALRDAERASAGLEAGMTFWNFVIREGHQAGSLESPMQVARPNAR